MHSRMCSLLECTRSVSLIGLHNIAAMWTAVGCSDPGAQASPAALDEHVPVKEGSAGERTYRASVLALSEAIRHFVQTLGPPPQTSALELLRVELLTSLVESAHSESKWAETVLANALGFTPSADAWMKESSEAEVEAGGDATLTNTLEYVGQRMA